MRKEKKIKKEKNVNEGTKGRGGKGREHRRVLFLALQLEGHLEPRGSEEEQETDGTRGS